MNDSPTPTTAGTDPSPPPGPIARARARWKRRHQHPFNLWMHRAGIPIAVGGAMMLPLDPYWGAGALGIGYFLQYVGHRVEGNDVGEWALIKRLLGLPYVTVAPRWQQAGSDVQFTRVELEPAAGADSRQDQTGGGRSDGAPQEKSEGVQQTE